MTRKRFLLPIGFVIGVIFLSTLGCTDYYTGTPYDVKEPGWRGIVPGRTTEDELTHILGKPDQIDYLNVDGNLDLAHVLSEFCLMLCGQRFYWYRHGDITIYARSNTVFAASVGILVFPETHLSDLIADYGNPEQVTWSRRSRTERVVIFPQHGLLAHSQVDPNIAGARIIRLVYFPPMPRDRITSIFWRELDLKAPPAYPTDIVATRMDPWNFNK